ncbi:hypothetical protein L2E82_07501 [Cichorium intybus]|uniref:Uncharacterized protein n=1 Tax=Cichorium intybus TaxID=13427 RepID=A0ACB9G537_CICIN|nr:hypothetical protein L2E82_07501 [Cichorium intybus]
MATSELAGQSSFKRKNKVLTVVLSVSSTALLLSAVAYGYRKKKRRHHKKGRGNWANRLGHTTGRMDDLDELPFFNFHRIAKATDNFNIDKKIGEGGFGPVYKGVLEDGQLVAVKRLSETSEQGLDEFKNEVICIAKLQHRNLVKLLGYCIHGTEMILIYEYMVNGSLDSFLFGQDALAKTKKVVGTYGYISPEYAVHGRFSIKSDVFSFGVLVLEMISGKKNRGFSHEGHNDNLLGHFGFIHSGMETL